jgi:hypothetical protein
VLGRCHWIAAGVGCSRKHRPSRALSRHFSSCHTTTSTPLPVLLIPITRLCTVSFLSASNIDCLGFPVAFYFCIPCARLAGPIISYYCKTYSLFIHNQAKAAPIHTQYIRLKSNLSSSTRSTIDIENKHTKCLPHDHHSSPSSLSASPLLLHRAGQL